MMAGEDDVMIADGGGEEVGCAIGVRQTDDLLSPAEVGARLIAHQLALFDKGAGEIARHLEDGDRPFFHITSDADADARFEMGVELVALNHIKRYGAMGKQHLARLWVDGGRIGLETADADRSVTVQSSWRAWPARRPRSPPRIPRR